MAVLPPARRFAVVDGVKLAFGDQTFTGPCELTGVALTPEQIEFFLTHGHVREIAPAPTTEALRGPSSGARRRP
jgi:hypothetical protein